jgi:hypothetical protein
MRQTGLRAAVLACGLTVFGMQTGCATILGGGERETVQLPALPTGQTVEVRNKEGLAIFDGPTPAPLTLKRGAGFFQAEKYTFTIKQNGSPIRMMEVKADLNGWYFGNIILGGLIGMLIVDPLTGAMWDLPDVINLEKALPVTSAGMTSVAAPVTSAPPSAKPVSGAQPAAKPAPAAKPGQSSTPARTAPPTVSE